MLMMYNPDLTRTIKTRLHEMLLDRRETDLYYISDMDLTEKLWNYEGASPNLFDLDNLLDETFSTVANDGYHSVPSDSSDDKLFFSRPNEMYRFINDTTFFYLTARTVPIYKSFKDFIKNRFAFVQHEIRINLVGCNGTNLELIRAFPTPIRYSRLMKSEAYRVIDSFGDLEFDSPMNEVVELLSKYGFIEFDSHDLESISYKSIELTEKYEGNSWATSDSLAKSRSNEVWAKVMQYHANMTMKV